jgi:type IV secretion system protein VirD4
MLAEMMFLRDKRGDSHWNEKGVAFVSGLILHVCATADAQDRHLPHVRKLAVRHGDDLAALIEQMLASPAAGGLVAEAAAELLAMPEKERGSVLSTVHKQTRFLSSPAMQRVLTRSTIDLADLKRRRVTLYLALPSKRLDTYKRWLRLMISAAGAAVTSVPGKPEYPVDLIIDEFQNLDRMEPILRGFALDRGHGITYCLVVQDIPRRRGAYPDEWESFFDNRSVLQAFGTSGPTTAEYLSKMLGEQTILTESHNRSHGHSSGKSSSTQRGAAETISEKGRRLLYPDEIINLPPHQQLLFVRGIRPVLCDWIDYLDDPEFQGQFDANPQHAAA